MEGYPRKGDPHQILKLRFMVYLSQTIAPHREEGQVCILGQVTRTKSDLVKLDERIDL